MYVENYIIFLCVLLLFPCTHTERSEHTEKKDVIHLLYMLLLAFCLLLLLVYASFMYFYFILFLPISYVYYSFMFRELLSTREKMNRKIRKKKEKFDGWKIQPNERERRKKKRSRKLGK